MAFPMVLAHIPIGQYSLPVPLFQILVGAVAVVAVSFGLIYLRPPRLATDEEAGRPLPSWFTPALAGVFSLYLAFVLVVAITGRQAVLLNAGALLFWVWTIPLLPILHVFLGGVYEVGNPFAFLAEMISGGRRLPGADGIITRVGYWPAVITLFGLVWAESIPEIVGSPLALGLIGLLYIAVQVSAGVLLGRGWYRGGEVFEAMTSLASAIAPVGLHRDAEGNIHLLTGFRPGRALPDGRGRQALITLWLAGVLADGIRAIPIWKTTYAAQRNTIESLGQLAGVDLGNATVITLEIVLTWAAFALFFWVFAALAARLASRSLRTMAGAVAPSLIPIALAYLLAHNLTQLAVVGPLMVTARDATTSQLGALVQAGTRFVQPGPVWWTQVTAIVAGHVLAVLMAHMALSHTVGEAGESAPRVPGAAAVMAARSAALRADLGWLAAMLLYTATSLWVLAQPITRD